MILLVLLAVEDSPDALAAASFAVDIARRYRSRLRIVHVLVDHEFDAARAAAPGAGRVVGGRPAATLVLRRVTALAEAAGLEIETALLDGDVGQAILDAARRWAADVVVIGRSRRGSSGEPYVGAQTRHVLEFAEVPVLVVPGPRSPR